MPTRPFAALSLSSDPAATVATDLPWTQLNEDFLSKMCIYLFKLTCAEQIPDSRFHEKDYFFFKNTHLFHCLDFLKEMIDINLPAFPSVCFLKSKSISLSPIYLTRKYLTSSRPVTVEQQSISLRGLNLVLTSALGLLVLNVSVCLFDCLYVMAKQSDHLPAFQSEVITDNKWN